MCLVFTSQSKVIPQVTPIHIACRYGNLEAVKVLITSCDVNVQDQWGFSALHYATVARHKELVLFMLANGASAILTSTVRITVYSYCVYYSNTMKFFSSVNCVNHCLERVHRIGLGAAVEFRRYHRCTQVKIELGIR